MKSPSGKSSIVSPTQQRQYRNALGQFTTGVTVITTRTPHGEPCGLTVNSFNSVSLDPPLVLWSLARSSSSLEAFTACKYFAVNVLSEDQSTLSNQFATHRDDRFEDIAYECGVGDVPLLPNCAAQFQCRSQHQVDGGDHVIFLGEVLEFASFGRRPLVFQQGGYTQTRPQAMREVLTTAASERYANEYLLPLLAQSFRVLSVDFMQLLENTGISRDDWQILLALADGPLTIAALSEAMPNRRDELLAEIATMQQSGLVTTVGDKVAATEPGKTKYVEFLDALQRQEQEALNGVTEADQNSLKQALRQVIKNA